MRATSRIACASALAITFTCAVAQSAPAQIGTTCTISGGGRVETPSSKEVTFGMAVVAPGLVGNQTYRDDTVEPSFTFHSEVVTSVACAFAGSLGRVGDITGQGRVVTNMPGGNQTEEVIYRIRVEDSGEASTFQKLDLYSITLSNGYSRQNQPVIFGNIRVEPGP